MIFLISLPVPCAASENIVKINDLIEQSVSFDNTEVTVQGEAIGEALERGEYTWININDTTNAIGIWVKSSDIDQIQFYGDYKHKGDTVKITGEFHRSCPEHGGDIDIHCTNIDIVEPGSVIKEPLSQNKVIIAVSVILITAVISAVYLKIKKSN